MSATLPDSSIGVVRDLLWPLLPGAPSRQPLASAQAIFKQRLLTLHSGGQFSVLPGWQGSEALSRSDQRSLHMHAFIGDLAVTYEKCLDLVWLCDACELVDDWCRCFKYPRDARSMAFHDETVARRLTYWLRLYLLLRTKDLVVLADDLWLKIETIVEIIIQDNFYAGLNNHGMFQDFALLYYSACAVDANNIQRMAMRRLDTYLSWSICEDGVHKEHSPSYHFLIASNIYRNLGLFESIDVEFACNMRNLLKKMGRYALNIVTPDGKYPPLGDTQASNIPFNYYRIFGVSQAKQELSAFFPEGGYAVMRDDPRKGSGQTYTVLCASHHGNYHKHRDDLSVLLYSGGWIVSESGPYGYDYADPLSRHGYSSAAHSTLLIDESNPDRNALTESGLVRLEEAIDSDGYCSARATNRRHSNLVHQRSLTLNRKKNLVEIFDAVDSEEIHTLSLLWQFAPELEVITVGDEIHLLRDGFKAAKMCIETDIPVRFTLIRGSQNTLSPGYVFPKMGECKETTVLRVDAPAVISWQCRTTFILPRRAGEALSLKLDTQPGPWPIQHYFEPCEGSKILVVVFPAMAEEHVYPIHYKKALQNAAVNRLFLVDDFGPQGSYLIASKGSLGLAEAVCSLIEEFRSRFCIAEDSVVFLGSSKGGASALYFAHRLGYGHAVVGAPQTRIGYFLHRQDIGNGPRLSRYMFPDTGAEERLDHLIYDLPVDNRVRRYIHVGSGDHHYKSHVLPYAQHVAGQGGEITLDIGDYATHKEVGIYFPAFIEKTLREVFNIPPYVGRCPPVVSVVLLSMPQGRSIEVTCTGQEKGSMHAHYLYQNGEVVSKFPYTEEVMRLINISGAGVFYVRVFVKSPDGKISIINTSQITAM